VKNHYLFGNEITNNDINHLKMRRFIVYLCGKSLFFMGSQSVKAIESLISECKDYLKLPILFIVLLMLITYTSYSQTPTNYKEKVYLHFDKSYYVSSDTIWYKAYVVNAKTNRPEVLSKILYVDLIDPLNKIISTRELRIEKGGAAGDFQLSTNMISGNFTIRAYTNYMRNFNEDYFFRKHIRMHNLNTKKEKKHLNKIVIKPDLQFFPEGGNMVNGIINRIGFKVIGSDGKGLSVSGSILDETGIKIVDFNTLKFGMGSFMFMPNQGKNYTAHINYRGISYSYILLKAIDKGVVMQVRNDKDVFKITLESSLPEGIKGLVVIGKQGDDIVCRSELSKSGFNAIVNIPKEYLTLGIVQFTVFDKNSIPLCERLAFVETKENEPKINILSSKDTYKSRDLIELNILLESQFQDQEHANMSIAVTDVSVVQKEKNGLNIKSYLLLNSELRGNIEQPNYYFESNGLERKQMLDVLMMTQGWRHYLWNDTKSDTLQKIKYEIEEGFTISGTVHKFYNKNKTTPAIVTLITMNKNTINNFKVHTNTQGKFKFGPYTILDSITVIIKAKKIKVKSESEKKRAHKSANNYTIKLDTREVPKIKNSPIEISTSEALESHNFIKNPSSLINKDVRVRYDKRSRNKYYNDSIIKVKKGTILLDEVTVIAEKEKTIEEKLEQVREEKRDILSKNPSHTIRFNELNYIPSNPLEALQGRLPGVQILRKPDGTLGVYLRENSLKGEPAQIFLNGAPIKESSYINSNDIDFIDIIKPPKSYIYGAKGHFGVVVIYTKNGISETLLAEERLKNEKKPEITRFVHPGYYQAKEFYSPVYNTSNAKLKQSDFRSTLYWNPNVKLNKKGEGKIMFYSSDISTTYRVALEGVTINGIPFAKETFIEIKD